MPIPFESARNGETPGVIGFLRFVDEGQGKGIRAALFATSALQLPLEFCFTRVDLADSVLWEEGQARRVAVVSLIRELFRSVNRTPDVVLGLADEIPPLVFSEEISVEIPVCRVSADPAPRRGASEEIEQLKPPLFLVWSTPPPSEGTVARRLLKVLAEHPNPLEPFHRVAAGIAEAYKGR
jgi:hypothetical protein